MRGVIRQSTVIDITSRLIGGTDETTSDTPRRRINRNERDVRRKITSVSASWSMMSSPMTRGSNGSKRMKRPHEMPRRKGVW